jgi:hypothetical protein
MIGEPHSRPLGITALIIINLLSDIADAVKGTEPRAIVGVPIALALLPYLLSNLGETSSGQTADQ